MTPLRPHMLAALHLSGQGARTQEASVREVRLRAQFYHKSPNRISAQERQCSFLHRQNVASLAPASMRRCYSGSRFFSQHVLTRDGQTFSLMRAQPVPRLPAVLRVEEGQRLLASATPLHNQVSCTTVSSLGLRLPEALFLPVSARDGQRLQVQGHRGTGATARYVPLPAETLALLRTSWTTHRPQTWLLPATGRDHTQRPRATSPMRRSRVPGACRTATHRAGMTTTGVAMPTLRHASATPLLEAGVNPRLIQRSLGHPALETPRIS